MSGCGLVFLLVSPAILTKYGLLNSSDGGNRIVLKANMELEDLFRVFCDGFSLEWPNFGEGEGCKNRGAQCGYDSVLGKVDYFCKVVHIFQPLIEYGWPRRCSGEPFLDSRGEKTTTTFFERRCRDQWTDGLRMWRRLVKGVIGGLDGRFTYLFPSI